MAHSACHCSQRTGAQREEGSPTPEHDVSQVRARHDPRAVRREAYGIHAAVVGLLYRRQRRGICAAQSRRASHLQPQFNARPETTVARKSTARGRARACAPHSLMYWSYELDTILIPSGEKATDKMTSLWAFVRSATGASDDASAPRTHTHTLDLQPRPTTCTLLPREHT